MTAALANTTTSPKTLKASSSQAGPTTSPAVSAGSNGGRTEMAKSKSGRNLLGTTKGTMKSLRNLVESLTGDHSINGHRSLRQFDHVELGSDTDGHDSHLFKDDSNSSILKDKDGLIHSFSDIVNRDDNDFPGAEDNETEVKQQDKGGSCAQSLNTDDSEGKDIYRSPASVMESIESADNLIKEAPLKSPTPSKKPARTSQINMHKNSSVQHMVANRFTRSNRARSSFRKSKSYGSLKLNDASTISRTPKEDQEAAGKIMHSRMAGLAKTPRGRRLRKANSLRSLTVSEMSPGPVFATDNNSTGSGSSGSRLSNLRAPRERRGGGMSKRKSRSLRSLNVSDFIAPTSTLALSNSSPRSKDYRMTALNSSGSPRDQRAERSIRKSKSMRGLKVTDLSDAPKEQPSHHSRRNNGRSPDTKDSPRDPKGSNRSLRKSHSVKGFIMTGLSDPSSSDHQSRRSIKSPHSANSPGKTRTDRSFRKSSSMRGLGMAEISDPGVGNSTQRNSRSRRSRSKSSVRKNDAVSNQPLRSSSKSSKGHLRQIHRSAPDISLNLDHTVTSVSSMSAGTARPSMTNAKAPSDDKGGSRGRLRSASRILEKPAAMAGANLPRRSSAESYLCAKAEQTGDYQKRDRDTQHNYNYGTSRGAEKSSRKQRSKSGKGLKELSHIRRPQMPPQGGKSSIDNSISSITVSSRFHYDDISLASDQRSHLRRAFSSPKLFFDGPYGSSCREKEGEDESTVGDLQAGGGSRISRWESRPSERNESAPTIPEHDLSSVGSTFAQPHLSRHASDGRWSNSTANSNIRTYGDPDSTPVRPNKEMSAHSRSIAWSYSQEPNTPSHSVQTGIISELTPATFGGSYVGLPKVDSTRTRTGRSEENGEFGMWMSSLHSLLLQDDEGHCEHANHARPNGDTLPRMARRHSFDSVSYAYDNSVSNVSQQESEEVRSVKSGFTSLMKYGENDNCPQKPNRRESTGSSALYYAPP